MYLLHLAENCDSDLISNKVYVVGEYFFVEEVLSFPSANVEQHGKIIHGVIESFMTHPGGRRRSNRGRSRGGRKVRKAVALPRMAGRLSNAHSSRSVFTAHLSVAAFLPLAKHALHPQNDVICPCNK